MAPVIASLLGVTMVEIPNAVSRRSNERRDTRHDWKWKQVNLSEIIDVDHWEKQYLRLGIRVVQECPKPDFTFFICCMKGKGGSPRGFGSSHRRNFTYLERDFEEELKNATTHSGGKRIQNVLVTSTFLRNFERPMTAGILWCTMYSPDGIDNNVWWPSRMFEAAISMVRFIKPPFTITPSRRPYGVFHLRAESDNIWMTPEAQLASWDTIRRTKIPTEFGLRSWYVASGMFHSGTTNKAKPFRTRPL